MKQEEEILKIKRGYLHGDFEFFHLKDKKVMDFESHYHEFNKIVVFISGSVTYFIEGKSYKLKPWDLLFISSNEVHRPIISAKEPYERIVLWVNSKFLEMHNSSNSNLLSCFELSSKEKLNLLRLNAENIKIIKNTLFSLENAINSKDFGSSILKNALFIELMVYLNRLFLTRDINEKEMDVEYDHTIEAILGYINENLTEDLSIESISSRFYINKYYLMHKFKDQTGYTLHSYIQQKRLISAIALIKKGLPITEVSIECGFKDYSSFVRAFKKNFGLSPKKYYKTILELENSYNIHKHS
ncbi:AraC family transcriptional regulator [Clostridium amazonitimonense]|uniref:AraC family transcriptional regulator n=1 Tax=Clostridium amazonitimonense TaxID=1499689 RepID=UPI000509CF4F|nr:AraC family transcriptional regulator [Clostridium amazonitimonense]